MSSVVSEHDERFGKTARSLLGEYGAKLDSIRANLENLRDRYRAGNVEKEYFQAQRNLESNAYKRFKPALLNFARRVSQQLEHGDLDDVTDLELQLRLADFESNIERTDKFFQYLARG